MTRAVGILGLALLALGCEPEPLEMRWFVRFPPGVDPSTVPAVGVRIYTGTCATPEREQYGAAFRVEGGELVRSNRFRPVRLGPGSHAFFFDARTTECEITARGCTDERLPAPNVTVDLIAMEPVPEGEPRPTGCPPARCRGDGTCETPLEPDPDDPDWRPPPGDPDDPEDPDDPGGDGFDPEAPPPEPGGPGGGSEVGMGCTTESPPVEEDCYDLVDDDCDTLVDCRDPDCASAMIGEGDGNCANGLDDDCDGLADCGDQDCQRFDFCICATNPRCTHPATETGACWNNFDDDWDGRQDCADPDCEGQGCGMGGLCRNRGCPGGCFPGCTVRAGCFPRSESGKCGNIVPNPAGGNFAVDDDCDGMANCLDSDCENQLCGDSWRDWASFMPWGNARCCGFACVGVNDETFCGSCFTQCPWRSASGTDHCNLASPHTSGTHNDSYVCACRTGDDCPEGFHCDRGRGQCECDYNRACGRNASCSSGTRSHCHPWGLRRN